MAKPTVVCRRFGDICLSTDRLLGDNLFETDFEANLGFWVKGVCILGTLKVGRGLERLGVGPPL